MFTIESIANKFRISYLLFALLLCTTFVSIFMYAEMRIEQDLVKGRLLQQLQLSQEKEGEQAAYTANPGIKIYRYDSAPENLKAIANGTVQEMQVTVNNQRGNTETNLHFFAHQQNEQKYILTYLEGSEMVMENYPVLAIFEELEDIFADALKIAVVLSLLIAALFSYLSSKQIIKPLLDLKQAVETDHQNLTDLTHLPSEVGVLARAIDEKNHKLEQYLKREQLFTGDVSHELRTPLTIIMGASEVLASQLEEHSRLSEFANRISTTAKETSEIISALLLLSRAPEQLDTPQTSINTIALNEVTRLTYLLRHKPVTCKVVAEQDYIANVRPELLKMALGNLIKNAFQYTDDGEVIVTIDAEKITVTDTGLGIPEIMMPLLYERFERLNDINTSDQVEGSGLGLSIVQRIMTHMDWELMHQDNATGGSTFSIYYNKCRI
ncbi:MULTISPECIES: sensor histidine kinase [unclassified Psychrobacter]|uniref:sensor histidine kinase n=1 Tax=unclassified Psychrobacter TaxID=196806 RepID=UPI0011EFFB55|nr:MULTISPECIES: HAMP domain-containing sensor histidine kinase [unclassified Psychrobacter]KAA0939546.1 HAMP domain-containing histidine kinase [Psychrobacter sp. ANT_H59]WAI87865.1 Sensor histidine kinase TmoS [Psychrobacter sp. SC65A.3]